MKRYSFVRSNAGDMGIGAMIVFIAMVLVAGIAASVLIQTANKLEIRAMTTGQMTTKEVSTGLYVVGITGKVTTGKIADMAISIRPRAGSSAIDLNQTIVEMTDGVTKVVLSYNMHNVWNFNLTPNATNGNLFLTNHWNETNAQFGIIVIDDADSSMGTVKPVASPVINQGDLVIITVNTQACFSGFSPRTNVWGQVVVENGAPGIFAFRVPATLSKTVYDLY